ncbi:hypothetical protein AB205_0038340 [Aquarana catesbeiana]|uniref:Transmembrane protein 243 n=1 Tax=Aquarana catesbeiana TaxID=8400 RepID=A0A2G9RIU7_AQUCT|nr:hypothetical protein AB205_0038340 [Aquarana catesbeiana]
MAVCTALGGVTFPSHSVDRCGCLYNQRSVFACSIFCIRGGAHTDLIMFPAFFSFSVMQMLFHFLNYYVIFFVQVTIISAFVFPQPPPKPVNVFFAFCILLCSITGLILIFWYRQGDLEPKFRNLIYYILFSLVLLCICANLYFHDVGK